MKVFKMKVLTMVLSVMALAPALGQAQDALTNTAPAVPAEELQESSNATYAFVLTTGPRFTPKDQRGEDGLPGMAEHVEYITSMHASGLVPLAGPLFERGDVAGAIYFVHARSEEEARAVVMKDPLVMEQVAEIESAWMFIAGVGNLD